MAANERDCDIVTFSVNALPYADGKLVITEDSKSKKRCKIGGLDFVSTTDGSSEYENFYLVEREPSGQLNIQCKRPIHFRPLIHEAAEDEIEEEESRDLKRAKLTEAFGSAKNIRKLNDAQQLSLRGNKDFLAAAAEVEKQSPVSTSTVDSIRDLLPPYDLTATNPGSVYDLTTVAQPPLLTALTEHITQLADATREQVQMWEQTSKYPLSVLRRLSSLPAQTDRRHRSAGLLEVLHCLIRLYRMPYKEVNRKDPLSDLPQLASSLLLKQYTEQSSGAHSKQRSMPARCKDKLLYHSLLLCLSLDNWTTELTDLQVDFKISANRLTKAFLAIGCKVSKSTRRNVTVQVASLTAPFTFPELASKSSKKKGK